MLLLDKNFKRTLLGRLSFSDQERVVDLTPVKIPGKFGKESSFSHIPGDHLSKKVFISYKGTKTWQLKNTVLCVKIEKLSWPPLMDLAFLKKNTGTGNLFVCGFVLLENSKRFLIPHWWGLRIYRTGASVVKEPFEWVGKGNIFWYGATSKWQQKVDLIEQDLKRHKSGREQRYLRLEVGRCRWDA